MRPVGSVITGLFVIALGLLASGAAIHHALYHDANSHSGPCAVCSFAKGQVEAADAPLAVCRPSVVASVAIIPTVSSLPQNPSLLLPPGRAPPELSIVS